jgi:hypothetical protein
VRKTAIADMFENRPAKLEVSAEVRHECLLAEDRTAEGQ